MFQLYGPDMRRRLWAIPAVYIEWRSGLFAEAGSDEDQAEHLHCAGSDLADDAAATATEGTLATGVEALLTGAADGLLSGCERARQSGFRTTPAGTVTHGKGCRSDYAGK